MLEAEELLRGVIGKPGSDVVAWLSVPVAAALTADTGHTVVAIATTSVVTFPLAGQFVTLDAQEVTV
jgi:hypothetical protein